MFRSDRDTFFLHDTDTLNAIRLQFQSALVNCKLDAVILCDYGKGFWTEELAQQFIRTCAERKILTITDLKEQVKWFGGSNFMKCNRKELEEKIGDNGPVTTL